MRVYFVLLIASVGFLGACGNDAAKQQGRAGKSADQVKDSATDDEASSSKDEIVQVEDGSPFALFCAQSAELPSPGQSPSASLGEALERFCAGAAPRKLLAETLPTKAYGGGTEKITLLSIAGPTDDKVEKTTAMTVAGAVALPVSAKTYFEGMLKYMDDAEAAAADGIKIIEGLTEETLVADHPSLGGAHVKGWEKRVAIDSVVSSQTVRSEYEYRSDYWELEPGTVYLMTSYLTKSIQGAKDSVQYAAVIQHGDQAYLLAQIGAKTLNRGLPAAAKDALLKLFRAGLKNVHGNASVLAAKQP